MKNISILALISSLLVSTFAIVKDDANTENINAKIDIFFMSPFIVIFICE